MVREDSIIMEKAPLLLYAKRVSLRIYANQTARPLRPLRRHPNFNLVGATDCKNFAKDSFEALLVTRHCQTGLGCRGREGGDTKEHLPHCLCLQARLETSQPCLARHVSRVTCHKRSSVVTTAPPTYTCIYSRIPASFSDTF